LATADCVVAVGVVFRNSITAERKEIVRVFISDI